MGIGEHIKAEGIQRGVAERAYGRSSRGSSGVPTGADFKDVEQKSRPVFYL